MTAEIYWIWLAERLGAGSALGRRLLAAFDTPEEVWRATRAQLAAAVSLTQLRLDALADKDTLHAQRIWQSCVRGQIAVCTLTDERYPPLLRGIANPPLVLYVRGTLPDLQDSLPVSVVGTRRATPYGRHAARYFAGTLAQNGCLIVSGMAEGIDGAANRAALDAGCETVAVLGCGVDVCYPASHRALLRDIVAHGAVISEYPPGTEPKGHHFPVRNRIITGMSRGILVVEAPKKSGALISADLALEQGRDVFAVPGDINRPNSAGCNALIRQGGAELVQTPADLLAHYERTVRADRRPDAPVARSAPPEHKLAAARPQAAEAPREMRTLTGSAQECAVWRAVRDGSDTVDRVVECTGLTASEVLTALTMLEVGAYVVRTDAGYRAADDVQLPQTTET